MGASGNQSSANNKDTQVQTSSITVSGAITELKKLNSKEIKTRFDLLQKFFQSFNRLPQESFDDKLASGLKLPRKFFVNLNDIIYKHRGRCTTGMFNASPEIHAQVEELRNYLLRFVEENEYIEKLKELTDKKKFLRQALDDNRNANIANNADAAKPSKKQIEEILNEFYEKKKDLKDQLRGIADNRMQYNEALEKFEREKDSLKEKLQESLKRMEDKEVGEILNQFDVQKEKLRSDFPRTVKAKNLPESLPETCAQWEGLLLNALINIPTTCPSHGELKKLYDEVNAVSQNTELQVNPIRSEFKTVRQMRNIFIESANAVVERVNKNKEEEIKKAIEELKKIKDPDFDVVANAFNIADGKAIFCMLSRGIEVHLNEGMLQAYVSSFLGTSKTELLMVLCHMYVAPDPDYINLKSNKNGSIEERYRDILLQAITDICMGKQTVKEIVKKIESEVEETPPDVHATNKNIMDAIALLKEHQLINIDEISPTVIEEDNDKYKSYMKVKNTFVNGLLLSFLNAHPNNEGYGSEKLEGLQQKLEESIGIEANRKNTSHETALSMNGVALKDVEEVVENGLDETIAKLKSEVCDAEKIKTRHDLLQAFSLLFKSSPNIQDESSNAFISEPELPHGFKNRLNTIVGNHRARCKTGVFFPSPETEEQVAALYEYCQNEAAAAKTFAQWAKLLGETLIKIPSVCVSHGELKKLYDEINKINREVELQKMPIAISCVAAREMLGTLSSGNDAKTIAAKTAEIKDQEKKVKIQALQRQRQPQLLQADDDLNTRVGTAKTMKSGVTRLTTAHDKTLYLNEAMLRLYVSDFLGASKTDLLMMLCHMLVAPKPDYFVLNASNGSNNNNSVVPFTPLREATDEANVLAEAQRYKEILLQAIILICKTNTPLKEVIENIESKIGTKSDSAQGNDVNKNIIEGIQALRKKGLNINEPHPQLPETEKEKKQHMKNQNTLLHRLLLVFCSAHPNEKLSELQKELETCSRAAVMRQKQ